MYFPTSICINKAFPLSSVVIVVDIVCYDIVVDDDDNDNAKNDVYSIIKCCC